VHGNIKSSNVLLLRDLEACISDFGLAQLLTSTAAASRVVGYRAPEITETRKVTQKSDVYSFGVVSRISKCSCIHVSLAISVAHEVMDETKHRLNGVVAMVH